MSDPSDIGGMLGGSAGAVVLFKYLWDAMRGRREKLEERVESDRDTKLDAVLDKLSAVELDMRSLVEKLSTQTGAVAEVKARVEGISNNHGSRIGEMERAFTELRTRIVSLETRRPRK